MVLWSGYVNVSWYWMVNGKDDNILKIFKLLAVALALDVAVTVAVATCN